MAVALAATLCPVQRINAKAFPALPVPGGSGIVRDAMSDRPQFTRVTAARRWGAWLLVTALALRALVPAGFMLAPGASGAEFVFCAAGAAHHHGGADGHSHSHGAGADPTCPFAQSAGPAPLPTLAAWVPPIEAAAHDPAAPLSIPPAAPGPNRVQSPRGPPSLT